MLMALVLTVGMAAIGMIGVGEDHTALAISQSQSNIQNNHFQGQFNSGSNVLRSNSGNNALGLNLGNNALGQR